MKFKNKSTKIFLLSTAFILFIISQSTITVYSHEKPSSRIINKLSFVTHEPLIIVQDSDFEVFPGSGTIEDPYIIEGYNFTNTGFYGIYIEGTTKSFIVRNCYFSLSYYGIVVNATSASNTRIEQNVFWDCVAGIVNQESTLSIIEENECYECTDGILILSSLYCEVNLNLLLNCYKGIEILNSARTNVTYNHASNNEYGIYVIDSDLSIFENNTCE
ncbi:MAG: right-handed parallel beta-helix repeat-containing protein, partial [Candidatus Heimdallarchaeota archaeon]|nr:right-handed parallel beta-helix repeat-containing protein [Candidatus Heimdallarchaeota archaeon]